MTLNLKIDNKNIKDDFKRIASEIMNEWLLIIDKSRYRITEIEFYLKSDFHKDDYTHGHILQKELSRWYFHGSGLDITFGDGNFFGGILIRGLFNMDTGEYTYGPIKIVTELFRGFQSIYKGTYSFGLIKDENNTIEIEEPIAAPRVGLKEGKSNNMYDEFYRFLVMPKKQHAEKTIIAKAMRMQKYTDEAIKDIWG